VISSILTLASNIWATAKLNAALKRGPINELMGPFFSLGDLDHQVGEALGVSSGPVSLANDPLHAAGVVLGLGDHPAVMKNLVICKE